VPGRHASIKSLLKLCLLHYSLYPSAVITIKVGRYGKGDYSPLEIFYLKVNMYFARGYCHRIMVQIMSEYITLCKRCRSSHENQEKSKLSYLHPNILRKLEMERKTQKDINRI
jgi:hypothetical protein